MPPKYKGKPWDIVLKQMRLPPDGFLNFEWVRLSFKNKIKIHKLNGFGACHEFKFKLK